MNNHASKMIQSWMSDNRVTEAQLSNLSGVPQSTIHRIATGQSRDPRRSNIVKIAEVIGTTAAALLGESTEQTHLKINEKAAKYLTTNLQDDLIIAEALQIMQDLEPEKKAAALEILQVLSRPVPRKKS